MAELKQIAIIPNGKRYWVIPTKRPETTHQVGEWNLKETADKKKPPLEGRIVAVGDEASIFGSSGCKYKFHDLVVFGSYAGNIHHFEGEDYTVLHEDEILGKVIETPFDIDDPRDLTK